MFRLLSGHARGDGSACLVVLDRHSECRVLNEVLDAVRSGESRALVVRGALGVGKSVLLDHLVEQAWGCRVERVSGVQSERALAFAGLRQLCESMLDRVERLAGPHQEALTTAFGLSGGPEPDRFRVGLAVLDLLAEVARERSLVCVVDDVQWLDTASVQALTFVARRLGVESVAVVIAVGDPADVPGSAGLPELAVTGLPDEEARALLTSALVWPVDEQVRDRIVAETRGNPLALVELSRGLAKGELAGGFGPVSTATLPSRIEGMAARSRALMTEGLTAEGVYCEAIDRLARAGVRSELARAHLCLAQRRGDAAPCAAGRAGHHRDPITKCLTIRRPRHGPRAPEGQNHGEPQRAP